MPAALVTDADTVPIDRLRRAGGRRRPQPAAVLSRHVSASSRRAITERHPQCSAEVIGLACVAVTCGDEPAGRVRAWMAARR